MKRFVGTLRLWLPEAASILLAAVLMSPFILSAIKGPNVQPLAAEDPLGDEGDGSTDPWEDETAAGDDIPDDDHPWYFACEFARHTAEGDFETCINDMYVLYCNFDEDAWLIAWPLLQSGDAHMSAASAHNQAGDELAASFDYQAATADYELCSQVCRQLMADAEQSAMDEL